MVRRKIYVTHFSAPNLSAIDRTAEDDHSVAIEESGVVQDHSETIALIGIGQKYGTQKDLCYHFSAPNFSAID
jgi:DNA-binding MurR/RpiR family transcriptional regulator